MHCKFLTASIALLYAGSLLAQPGNSSTQPPAETIGPNPRLAKPDKKIIPTLNIAIAKGWPEGSLPIAAAGL